MGATIESLRVLGRLSEGRMAAWLDRCMRSFLVSLVIASVVCHRSQGLSRAADRTIGCGSRYRQSFLKRPFFSLTTSATCIGNVRTKGDGTSSGFPESFEAALLLGGGRLRFGPAVPGHHEFGDGKHHTRVFHLLLHVLSNSQSKCLTIVLTRVLQ